MELVSFRQTRLTISVFLPNTSTAQTEEEEAAMEIAEKETYHEIPNEEGKHGNSCSKALVFCMSPRSCNNKANRAACNAREKAYGTCNVRIHYNFHSSSLK